MTGRSTCSTALPRLGRTREVMVTVLDLPVVGRDRDDTWARVERLRGSTPAAAYARRTNAGTPAEQRDRYAALADRGVDTVFLALADLDGPEDVLALRRCLLELGAGQAEHPAGHDQLLDLLGALEDVEDLGVAGPLLEQLGLAVAERARRARRS